MPGVKTRIEKLALRIGEIFTIKPDWKPEEGKKKKKIRLPEAWKDYTP